MTPAFRSRARLALATGVFLLPGVAVAQSAATPPTDLDTFMARVLERRDETWKTLHDYVLDETERLAVTGPADVPLYGMRREFTWYVRDGYLIRSPLRFDGVTIDEAARRAYEQRWLDEERARERRRREKAAGAAGGVRDPGTPPAPERPAGTPPLQAGSGARGATPSLDTFLDERGEPRFVSEAYFFNFKFEPGNYYLAGHDRVNGRDVLKIEYYPTRLFAGEDEASGERANRKTGDKATGKPRENRSNAHPPDEEDLDRKFNKVAMVTLWIDPAEYQIVRYTFDNVDFGFLPGRWLVRVDQATVTMTTDRVFEGVWLPQEIRMRAGFTLANGSYSFEYRRGFSNYKKAETRARVRIIGAPGR